ncbi:MAG: hypothetical protein ACYDD5_00190 [Sulfuricurvum sp.]
MAVDLNTLCDFIIPQSLQDNSTINSLLQIYFKENNQLDVSNPIDLLNLDFLTENVNKNTSNNIRTELIKIHLQEIYDTLDDIIDDVDVYNRFKQLYEQLGLSISDFQMAFEIEDTIMSEYISASRSFKTKKGNKTGFFFAYDLVNKTGIQKISTENHFKLLEGTHVNPKEPYTYRIETSLYKEIYHATVAPLAHPVGFEYIFTRLLYLILEDNYNYIEATELEELNIACYSYVNGIKVLNSIDGLSGIFGTFKSINTSTNLRGEVRAVIDFFPKQAEALANEDHGIRLYKDYNGNLSIYNKQDDVIVEEGPFTGEHLLMELSDVELLDGTNGIMHPTFENKDILGVKTRVFTSLSYKEYTIIDKPSFKVKFKIIGDKPDVWYTSTIILKDKSISLDKKFFNKVYVTRKEILEGCTDYNGRLIEDRGEGCQFSFKVNYVYKLAVDDLKTETHLQSIEDIWARKHTFSDIGYWIGEQIHDPSQTIINDEPFIDGTNEDGEHYIIGYTPEIKTDYMETEFGKWEDENLRAPVYKARLDNKNIVEKTDEQVENSEYIAWEKTETTELIYATPSKEHYSVTSELNYVGDSLLIDNNLTDLDIEDFKLGAIRAEITGEYNLKYFKYDDIVDGTTYNWVGYGIRLEKVDADPVNFQYITKEEFSLIMESLLEDFYGNLEESLSSEQTYNVSLNETEYTRELYNVGDILFGDELIINDYEDIDIVNGYRLFIGYIEYIVSIEGESFNNILFDDAGNLLFKNMYDDDLEMGIYRNGVLLTDNNVSSYP